MSLLKGIFSLIKEKVDNLSEVKESPAITEERSESTIETKTNTPNHNKELISKFTYNGEIKRGTELTVPEGQSLVLIKKEEIINLLESGTYTVDENEESDFTSSSLYLVSLKESDKIEWRTNSPIVFSDVNFGELSIHLHGTYSYRISDIINYLSDFIKSSSSVEDYSRNLLINYICREIYNNNGTSYNDLPKVLNNNPIKGDSGIVFMVNIDDVILTDDSKAKINNAM